MVTDGCRASGGPLRLRPQRRAEPDGRRPARAQGGGAGAGAVGREGAGGSGQTGGGRGGREMAAALRERKAEGRVRVLSAGSEPANRLNPAVVEAISEIGIDIS